MNFRTALLLCFCCLLSPHAGAQQRACTLTFRPVLAGKPLEMGEDTPLPTDSAAVSVDELRFYVSGLRLLRAGAPVWEEPHSFHLVDAAQPGRAAFTLALPAGLVYDEVRFQLGIDSATNVAGVMGGDLDPSNGMYWTWQSGYINVKLEGLALRCPARKHRFRFHLGGYGGDHNCLQAVSLPASGPDIPIVIALDPFFAATDLQADYEVMIPGPGAVSLAQRFAQCFQTARP